MAQTTSTGAKKIQGTDDWRDIFDVHNDTVDAYDGLLGSTSLPTTAQTLTGAIAEHESDISSHSEAIANLQDGLAIVATGNTHAAIPAGAFVYVKNHGTLADGLYTNTSGSTIAQDATLSSSNLTADASGGLNVLNNNLTTLSNNVSNWETMACTASIGTAIVKVNKTLKMAIANFAAGQSGTGDGTITITDTSIKASTEIFNPLRNVGYLKTTINSNVINISSATAWDVSSIVFPII